ncbi:MAG TPA: hypothetical protein VGB30_04500 [bacterium]
MSSALKIAAAIAIMLSVSSTACPGKSGSETHQDVYHIGIWGGTITVEAYMVMLDGREYANEAWRIESQVSLDEYSDGSLKGIIVGDLFKWSFADRAILEFDDIAVGHWDDYTQVQLDITGSFDNDGYKLETSELPSTLPNTHDINSPIDFWDFLYPQEISDDWGSDAGIDGAHLSMKGQSTFPQGEDFLQVSGLSAFKEFGVIYTWDINKL